MEIVSPNEKLIKEIHPSRLYFWQNYFMAGLIIAIALVLWYFILFRNFNLAPWIPLPAIFIGLAAAGFGEISVKMYTYCITDKRIIESFSFLSRRINSIDYSKIQNFDFEQTLTERILNIADLEFHTASPNEKENEIIFRGIRNPLLIKNIITDIKLKDGQSSGL